MTMSDNNDEKIADDEYIQKEKLTDIINEFTRIEVSKVLTPKGERLEIVAPLRGHTIRLDPLELEALTWQSHGIFSKLLEEPLGPENRTSEESGEEG